MTQEEKELALKVLKTKKVYIVNRFSFEIECMFARGVIKDEKCYSMTTNMGYSYPFREFGNSWAFDRETLENGNFEKRVNELKNIIQEAKKELNEMNMYLRYEDM